MEKEKINNKVPSFDALMIPTLEALKKLGGSASIDELPDTIADSMGISEEARNQLHGITSQTELAYRLAWARTYLKAGGAIDNSERGVWNITDYGETITASDIENIKKITRSKVPSAKQANKKSDIHTGHESRESLTDWREDLLSILLEIEPAAFERLCQRILRESGFTRVEVTGKSGDGGIDGVGILRVNLVSFRVVFQAKRWKGSVGSQEVRLFQAAMMGRADKGLIITTGNFTSEARKEAVRDGAPAVDLVDGELLCELLKDLKLGVALVTNFEINNAFFNSI